MYDEGTLKFHFWKFPGVGGDPERVSGGLFGVLLNHA